MLAADYAFLNGFGRIMFINNSDADQDDFGPDPDPYQTSEKTGSGSRSCFISILYQVFLIASKTYTCMN
jgi:hypothetical protein